ncbi:MAG TPA: isoprenylcysteine carboxylmethyltransferase family protein [Candidatus Ozemobacteraceae bacterium]|nr:isoprenylcysteine carboxylmethyltransferase family protein [Candidatus Ozemobacteraceae bacterium]
MNHNPAGGGWRERVGGWFFRWRDLLPVPIALMMLRRTKFRPFGWLCGIPLVLLGELLRLAALRHIGPTTRTREICADRLVTTGPYAWVRHPLYLANALKVVGIALCAGDLPAGALAAVFYSLEFSTMIPFEEAYLKDRFPESFESWAARTPAFLPMPPAVDADTVETAPKWSWAEAFGSERRTFASTGLMLAVLAVIGFRRRGRTA